MRKMGETQLYLKKTPNIPGSLRLRGWNVKSVSSGRMLKWLGAAKKQASEAGGSLASFTAFGYGFGSSKSPNWSSPLGE